MKIKIGNGNLKMMCPGCQKIHVIPLITSPDNNDQYFHWNGNIESPSVLPSILINKTQPEKRCHFYLIDGKIHYQADCFHSLQSQTTDLPNL